jgi:CheY-like chemotaxis protein
VLGLIDHLGTPGVGEINGQLNWPFQELRGHLNTLLSSGFIEWQTSSQVAEMITLSSAGKTFLRSIGLSPKTAGITVLIVVDDVALVGRPLERKLKKNGYKVIEEIPKTADGAIAICRERRPQIVLMDLQLQDPTTHKPDDSAGARAGKTIQEEIGAQIIYVTHRANPILREIRKTRDFQLLRLPMSDEQLLSSMRLAAMKSEQRSIVFLCYSHTDYVFAEELEKFFKPFAELGIDFWSDTRIEPGRMWKLEIAKALNAASAAVCLVSIDFINSDFINEIELPKLLKAAQDDGARIFPAFLRPVPPAVLRRRGLLDFQGVNAPSDPMADWTNTRRERCWSRLAEQVEAGKDRPQPL